MDITKAIRNLEMAEVTINNTIRSLEDSNEEKIVLETIAHNLKQSISRMKKQIRKENKR